MCGPRKRRLGPSRFLEQVGEGHAVVGEHGVDLL